MKLLVLTIFFSLATEIAYACPNLNGNYYQEQDGAQIWKTISQKNCQQFIVTGKVIYNGTTQVLGPDTFLVDGIFRKHPASNSAFTEMDAYTFTKKTLRRSIMTAGLLSPNQYYIIGGAQITEVDSNGNLADTYIVYNEDGSIQKTFREFFKRLP